MFKSKHVLRQLFQAKGTQKTHKVEVGFEAKEIKSDWEKLSGVPDGKRIGTERVWAISGQSWGANSGLSTVCQTGQTDKPQHYASSGVAAAPLPQGLQQASSTGHSWAAPVPDPSSAASTAGS